MLIDDPRKQKLILFSIAFATFIGNLDYYIVNVSLVTIAREFHASTGDMSWVLLAYQLTITAFLLLFGKLGDKFGTNRVFIFGFAVFTVGSLACAAAPSLFTLILSRAVQGLGASVLYSMPPAMVSKYLPYGRHGQAFGILSTTAAVGMILGAPLGGIITGYFSWRWAFLINVPIGIMAVIAARWILPGDEAVMKEKPSGGFDVIGAFFSFVAVVSLFYALSIADRQGWSSPVILTCFVLSVLCVLFFVYWEKRRVNPLVDLALFSNRPFAAENVSCALAYAFLAGNNFIMPFYLYAMKGLSPQKTGAVFILYSLVYMVTGPVAGKLSARFEAATLSSVSMFFAAAGIFLFCGFYETRGLVPVCIFFACNGFAMATFGTTNNTSVMSAAPKGQEGMVAGVLRMMMRLGMAAGVTVFQMVFALAAGEGGTGSLAGVPYDRLSSGFFYSLVTAGVLCFVAAVLPLLFSGRQAGRP